MTGRKRPKGFKKSQRMGRPPIEVDWEVFKKLCQLHCTAAEIAAFLGCSTGTLDDKCRAKFGTSFCEVFKSQSVGGNVSLRRVQWRAAMNGSITMMIWLGKQYLGQTDKVEANARTTHEQVAEFRRALAEQEAAEAGVQQAAAEPDPLEW